MATTKAQMLESVAAARNRLQSAPGSRAVIEIDEVLSRLESAFAGDGEPDDAELKAILGGLISPLERMIER